MDNMSSLAYTHFFSFFCPHLYAHIVSSSYQSLCIIVVYTANHTFAKPSFIFLTLPALPFPNPLLPNPIFFKSRLSLIMYRLIMLINFSFPLFPDRRDLLDTFKDRHNTACSPAAHYFCVCVPGGVSPSRQVVKSSESGTVVLEEAFPLGVIDHHSARFGSRKDFRKFGGGWRMKRWRASFGKCWPASE